ncbi:MAG: FAD-binding protein [Hungatella sp.]|jgi:flavocytochrome c|nr:FAD-binding protein [Hungatella sp.]
MKKRMLALCVTAAVGISACSSGGEAPTTEAVQESETTATETTAAQADTEPAPEESASGTFEGKGNGFGGELQLKVTVTDGKMEDIEVVSHHESSVVFNRALPIITERILEAQSPEVDSVTGATFTSYAVKAAVAEAMKEQGTEFGEITFTTQGPAVEQVQGEDVHTQLVIVGGGPAGLGAAITAKENGLEDVLVVEKLDILSGNGKFDLNFYDVFNSEAQKANGVEDSIEKFIEDMKDAGNTPERLQVWAEGESVIDAWLRSFGVELDHNYGGRNHMKDKDNYAGEAIQDGMEAQAQKLGVEIRTGTKGTDLIFDGDKVVGVTVESKAEKYNIMADAVILATGGFSYNKDLLAKYAPGYEVLNTSNQMGATGDFVPVFEKYGFKMEHMDTIRVIPTILIPSRDLTNSGAGSVYVNGDGQRFVNERLGGLEMGNAILDQDMTWMVVDTKKVEDNANVRKQVKGGKFIEAATWEELADLMGVNKENFVKTIEAYNKNAEDGAEDEFGHTPERALLPEGPYYASKIESAVHMTKGGVSANEHAQILREDGSVVDGLYGAGEVTWQSGGYSQSVVFGRISGQEAAAYIQGN